MTTILFDRRDTAVEPRGIQLEGADGDGDSCVITTSRCSE
jgi:hypothetical protein